MWRILALLALAALASFQAFDALRGGRLESTILLPLMLLIAVGLWRRKRWTVASLATLAYANTATLLATVILANRGQLFSGSVMQLMLNWIPAVAWLSAWSFAAYAAHRAAREVGAAT